MGMYLGQGIFYQQKRKKGHYEPAGNLAPKRRKSKFYGTVYSTSQIIFFYLYLIQAPRRRGFAVMRNDTAVCGPHQRIKLAIKNDTVSSI
jgi:hypothetical protein